MIDRAAHANAVPQFDLKGYVGEKVDGNLTKVVDGLESVAHRTCLRILIGLNLVLVRTIIRSILR
jgi:hypothetical protein